MTFTGVIEYTREDGGQALIAEVDCDDNPRMFVRVQSWDDGLQEDRHPEARFLEGKRVRLTLEVLEDE